MRNWKLLEWFFFLFALYVLANGIALYYNFHHENFKAITQVIQEDK